MNVAMVATRSAVVAVAKASSPGPWAGARGTRARTGSLCLHLPEEFAMAVDITGFGRMDALADAFDACQ
jgi:hypothetical protein